MSHLELHHGTACGGGCGGADKGRRVPRVTVGSVAPCLGYACGAKRDRMSTFLRCALRLSELSIEAVRGPLAALVLAGALATPLSALAGLSAEQTFEVRKNISTSTTDVAVRPDGGFIIVWDRFTNAGQVSTVEGRRFAADGSPIGDVFSVSGHDAGYAPSIALSASGRFLVVWQEGDVYGRLFAANGSPAGDPFIVNGPPAAGHARFADDSPSLSAAARDGDGFAVAFVDGDGVRVVRLDGNGNVRGGFSTPVSGIQHVAVDGLPGGRLVLAWSSKRYRYLSNDSEGDVGRVDGVVLSSADEVIESFRTDEDHSGAGGSYDYIVDGEARLAVAASATGVFSTAYDSAVPRYLYNADDHDGGYPLGARFERFASPATPLGGLFVHDHATSGRVADVAMTPGANAVSAVEGERLGIRAIDCRGTVLGDELLYVSSDNASAVSASSIAVNERGDGVVVWAEQRPAMAVIAARRFHLDDGCSLCGDADANGRVSAADSLIALRTGVGTGDCSMERCDADGSNRIGSRDAVRILRAAIADGAVSLTCSRAPQIDVGASSRLNLLDFSVGFSLIADPGGATLVWSQRSLGMGSVHSRHVDAALDVGAEELLAGPDQDHIDYTPTGCSGDEGLAVAWTGSRESLPEGVTLDLSNVLLSLPDQAPFAANTTVIGSQSDASVACLAGGRYAISWTSVCEAVEVDGDSTSRFRPDECDDELADGAYVQVFGADGTPIGSTEAVANSSTRLAPIDGNRFVAASGPVVQVRSSDGSLLSEASTDEASWPPTPSLSCSGSRCARAGIEGAVVFDTDHLGKMKDVLLQPSMRLGPDRTIHATDISVACDDGGACLAAWRLRDSTMLSESYESAIDLGIYARAFDLATGAVGEPVMLRFGTFDGVRVVAVAPGVFIAAVPDYYSFTLHRIELR